MLSVFPDLGVAVNKQTKLGRRLSRFAKAVPRAYQFGSRMNDLTLFVLLTDVTDVVSFEISQHRIYHHHTDISQKCIGSRSFWRLTRMRFALDNHSGPDIVISAT